MEDQIAHALRVKEMNEAKLRRFVGVTGVGVGYKQIGGQYTKQVAIIVYVKKKLPRDQIPPSQLIPIEIDGVPTDVVEATFQALSAPRTSKIRPAVGGISVGHYLVTAGTISNIFYDFETLKLKLVSNNHVIAHSAPFGDSKVGDPIYQPGPYDGGTADDTIAYLERWFELKQNCPIDGAVGDPVSQDQVSVNHYDFGEIKAPVVIPKLGDIIQKGGRTTGLTEGEVIAVNITADVGGYPQNKIITFVNQIAVYGENIAKGGDSGSLGVLKGTSNPYGILFAGSSDGTLGVFNPFLTFSSLLKVGVPAVLDITVKTPEGKPAVGTLVELPAYKTILSVDENGNIIIGNLQIGAKYTLNFVHPDYQLKTVEITPEQMKQHIEVTLETKPPPPPSLGQRLINASSVLIGATSVMGIIMTTLTPTLKEEFMRLKEAVLK